MFHVNDQEIQPGSCQKLGYSRAAKLIQPGADDGFTLAQEAFCLVLAHATCSYPKLSFGGENRILAITEAISRETLLPKTPAPDFSIPIAIPIPVANVFAMPVGIGIAIGIAIGNFGLPRAASLP